MFYSDIYAVALIPLTKKNVLFLHRKVDGHEPQYT